MKKIVKRVSNIVNKMEPTQIMVIGFAIVILIGAILLSMPISTQNGESIGFLDALINNYNLNPNWWIRIYDCDNIVFFDN